MEHSLQRMPEFFLEFVEQPHVYLRDGQPLFAGTPDKKRVYPKSGITLVLDYKMGRSEVPSSDVNMQLRSYLCMIPASELEGEPSVSKEFRPSSLLRMKNCPGSRTLEAVMNLQGLGEAESSEDAAEGSMLHHALANPNASRSDLNPEQIDIVEKAEAMAEKFIEFALSTKPSMPFFGAIIQPRVSSSADIVGYSVEDIAEARKEIDSIWNDAHHSYARRNATADGCRFCPCKALCPEYRAWVMPVEAVRRLPVTGWSDEQMDRFESRRTELVKFINDAHEQIKAIKAANPERLPGWELKDGANIRSIEDLPAAWAALEGIISAKDFSEQCDVRLGGLEEVIWRSRRDGPMRITQKEAKEILNSSLGALLKTKQNKPSLVKKKT